MCYLFHCTCTWQSVSIANKFLAPSQSRNPGDVQELSLGQPTTLWLSWETSCFFVHKIDLNVVHALYRTKNRTGDLPGPKKHWRIAWRRCTNLWMMKIWLNTWGPAGMRLSASDGECCGSSDLKNRKEQSAFYIGEFGKLFDPQNLSDDARSLSVRIGHVPKFEYLPSLSKKGIKLCQESKAWFCTSRVTAWAWSPIIWQNDQFVPQRREKITEKLSRSLKYIAKPNG